MIQTINYYWRLFATAIAFTAFGVGGTLIPLIATPILALLPGDRYTRRNRARKLVHFVFKTFIYFMKGLGILSWDIQGVERIQRPKILVLANHPTLLDVVFLIAFIPHADCIVKNRLLNNLSMRGFISLTGYITNDKGDVLIENAQQSLDMGGALIIFPEGTRTKPGQKLTFQRGAANIVVRANINPTPVIITCKPITLSKEHRWYHIPNQKPHISIRVLEDLDVQRFTVSNASLQARQLTRQLEKMFTEEITINEHGFTGA